MSVATLHVSTPARPRRAPGRPRRELSRADRLTRIKAVALLLGRTAKARGIALAFDVSRATLFTWRTDVLESYADPEAVELRRIWKDRR